MLALRLSSRAATALTRRTFQCTVGRTTPLALTHRNFPASERYFVNFTKTAAEISDKGAQEEAARKRRVQELRARISKYSISDPLHLRAGFASLLSRSALDSDVVSFSSQALTVGSYATAALVIAGTLGIDTTPVLALAGSTGVALGFALRDFVSNFLSGFLLIAQRPFKPGDFITVTMASNHKVEGFVEAIDFRLVHLRSEEAAPQVAPSATSTASGTGSSGAATSGGAAAPPKPVVRHILIPTSAVYNGIITLRVDPEKF